MSEHEKTRKVKQIIIIKNIDEKNNSLLKHLNIFPIFR